MFEENSVEDLICRGYSRQEILDITGIDPGYHNRNYRHLAVDKLQYKYDYILSKLTLEELTKWLQEYQHGASKDDFLILTGIRGDKSITLSKFYDHIGLGDEFKKAHNIKTSSQFTTGMLEKHGVDNPFKLSEFQNKGVQTRNELYQAPYTLSTDSILASDVRTKINVSVAKSESKLKRQHTIFQKYGVHVIFESPSIREKIQQTLLAKYNVAHVSEIPGIETKKQQTILSRYGVKHVSQVPEFKLKAQKTMLARYGVPFYSQTEKARKAQAQRARDNHGYIETKKLNGTTSTSSIEELVANKLMDMGVVFERNYISDDYPFACDFYIPESQLYVEINAHWTHNNHWYSENDDVSYWQSKNSDFYDKEIDVWSVRDVEKRKSAKANNLNYVTLWNSSDIDLWLAMGMPGGHDYDVQYSWLPNRQLGPQLDRLELTGKQRNVTKIARQYNFNTVFERELDMWNNNTLTNKGYTQAFIYGNRYKYLGKLPHELTDAEILRAFAITGLVRTYSTFDNKFMQEAINKYNIKSIVDPFAGWGERLLTAIHNNSQYTGVDINSKLTGHLAMIADYGDKSMHSIIYDDARNISLSGQALITCPPYGDIEHYTDDGLENLSEVEFLSAWDTIIKNSDVNYVMFQINQQWKNKLTDIVIQNGYELVEEMQFGVTKSHLTPNKKEFESFMILEKI